MRIVQLKDSQHESNQIVDMIANLKYCITNAREIVRIVKGFVGGYKGYDGRWTIWKKKRGEIKK